MVVASFANSLLGGRTALLQQQTQRCRSVARAQSVRAAAQVAEKDAALGFKMMRSGIKEAGDETVLTPRFYTTDFDEMEELFSLEKNPTLDMEEFDAMLSEFKTDYNQTHFVRNETFKKAADNITGPARKIFIEFLELSCTAEFSGFLLYKELGRRLKKTNPVGEPSIRCLYIVSETCPMHVCMVQHSWHLADLLCTAPSCSSFHAWLQLKLHCSFLLCLLLSQG